LCSLESTSASRTRRETELRTAYDGYLPKVGIAVLCQVPREGNQETDGGDAEKLRETTTTKTFFIPFFCIIFIIYSLVCGLPSNWLLWAMVAFILDLIVNPVYTRTRITTVED